MRIAIISDIHSNFNALEKVIYQINNLKCDLKICLGDMIGYYDKPNEVVNSLKESNFKCIKGNHEKFILGELQYKLENSKLYGVERHRSLLSNSNLDFLKECPNFFDIEYNGKKYFFCHSLKENSQYYLRDIDSILNKFEEIKQYDYYFYGHTHQNNITYIKDHILINPGSVGQQRGNDWRPTFCLINLESGLFEIRTVEYDIKEYINDLSKKNYESILIDIFNRNIK